MKPPKQQYLFNPDGSKTHYVELEADLPQAGHRQPETLVLLHGLGADHAMWQPQMQPYASAGFHLLIPDLFGHGESSKCRHLCLADWHRQLNWLLAQKAIEQCTLIGVSMGGVIAQSFTVEHPHRVKALVIADSFGELRTITEKLLGFSQILGFSLFKVLGKKLLAKAMGLTYQAPYAQAARAYFEQVSLTADLDQLILARRAINRIDGLRQLQTVTVPAMVIVGAEFGQAFIRINRKIAEALPNAEFAVLTRSRDPSNLVNPIEFNQQVLRFLTQKLS